MGASSALGIRSGSSCQGVLDRLGGLRSGITHEGQGRGVAQLEPLADGGAQHALGRLESGSRAGDLLVGAHRGPEQGGVTGVPGQTHIGDRHEAQAGILDTALKGLGHHDSDLIG